MEFGSNLVNFHDFGKKLSLNSWSILANTSTKSTDQGLEEKTCGHETAHRVTGQSKDKSVADLTEGRRLARLHVKTAEKYFALQLYVWLD